MSPVEFLSCFLFLFFCGFEAFVLLCGKMREEGFDRWSL